MIWALFTAGVLAVFCGASLDHRPAAMPIAGAIMACAAALLHMVAP